MNRTYWNTDNTPIAISLDKLLYDIRKDDGADGLLFDAVSFADIIEDADGRIALDAMLSPYNKLEAKMGILQKVMERAGTAIKPVSQQLSEPFTQNGTANVACIFELSDGQTISVFFHNPDTTPKKILPTDEMVSWKWLLNKKDITIVVAPEKGKDLNVRQVATRLMKLAEKNSPAFQRANAKRAEKMQAIQGLKDEIVGLEKTLSDKQKELEVAKIEAEDRAAAKAMQEPDAAPSLFDQPEAVDTDNRVDVILNELARLGWKADKDGKQDILIKGRAWIYRGQLINKKTINIHDAKYTNLVTEQIEFEGSAFEIADKISKAERDINPAPRKVPSTNTQQGVDPVDLSLFDQPANDDKESALNTKAASGTLPLHDYMDGMQNILGNDFQGFKSSLSNDWYRNVESGVKKGGKITPEVFESMESGQKYHFNKTYNQRNDAIEAQADGESSTPSAENTTIQQGIDPVAKANIEAANISAAIKKKAIAYLNANPTSHKIEGISPKSLSAIMESIKTALFAEIKALSPLFKEEELYKTGHISVLRAEFGTIVKSTPKAGDIYSHEIMIGLNPSNILMFSVTENNNIKNILDSSSTIEDLRSWGFALPFDLDVKAFVANVIKPVVDEFLSKQAGDPKVFTLIWSEASEVENKDFSSLNELQLFIRKEFENKEANVPLGTYRKHKIRLSDKTELRVDVGRETGDFNPFKDNLSQYLKKDGYSVDTEPNLTKSQSKQAGNQAEQSAPEVAEPQVVEPTPETADPEDRIRALWTEQGVSKERQDELIADITEKAKNPFDFVTGTADKLKAFLAEGDLKAALDLLKNLNKNPLIEVLLRAGFPIAGSKSKTIKEVMDYVSPYLVKAARLKTDGYGVIEQEKQQVVEPTPEVVEPHIELSHKSRIAKIGEGIFTEKDELVGIVVDIDTNAMGFKHAWMDDGTGYILDPDTNELSEYNYRGWYCAKTNKTVSRENNATPTHSNQFKVYEKHINEEYVQKNKPLEKGFVEAIDNDVRLNEGEAEALIAMTTPEPTPEVVAEEEPTGSSSNADIEAEIESLRSETDNDEFNKRLDDLAATIEERGLMEQYDKELNELADIAAAMAIENSKRIGG